MIKTSCSAGRLLSIAHLCVYMYAHAGAHTYAGTVSRILAY